MVRPHQNIRQILMTADTMGGVWTYALDLCAVLGKYGIRVCLATMGSPLSSGQQKEAAQRVNLTVRQSTYRLEWMDEPWSEVEQAGKWLLALEKEIKPDLIHLNGFSHGALNWSAPVVVVAHSCVLSWWQAVKKEQAPENWNEYKWRVQDGLFKADAVVAISHTYANELKSIYGMIPNLSVIYNGRDPEVFYALDKKYQAFAMGRVWDEAKNLRLLNQISNTTDLPISVAGDNYHPESRDRVLITGIELLGHLSQSEIKRRLAESYIYIHPARYEPFGLSVLEAALSRCLLVLADIPSLKELWKDTALYFDPNKPGDLDQVLEYIRQNPQDCRKLVDRSYERAKLFSLNIMGQHYYNFYESLVSSRSEFKEEAFRHNQSLKY
jgi:glycogen(starch) synthase